MNKRIALHVLFWLTYLLWSGYILGSYDGNFTRSFLNDISHLPLKITVTYIIMYYLLPNYVNTRKYSQLFFYLILLVIFSSLIQRFTIYRITQPNFYPESTFYFWNFPKLLWGAFDVFSIAAIALSIKLFKNRYESQQREEELKREKLETELRFLKAQINPHFLFNTLNSIYALTRVQSEAAPDAVMRLSKILRYILYETDKSTTIEKELRIVDDYIELQKLRFGKKINVAVVRDVDDPQKSIAQLIILPLVENAFKHGIGHTTEVAEILIKVDLKKNDFRVHVINPVTEISVNEESSEGIGLVNISRQLQLLYKSYNFSHEQRDGNFFVDLQIDLNSYKDYELPDHRR
jgi:two-component system LytT family sensor kinase